MKPIIGITPEISEEGAVSLLPAYTHAIESAGGIPVVLPCTQDEAVLDALAAMCHGFCFSGGEDISPDRYGQTRHPKCGEPALRRDAFDFKLFEKALPTGKPILGICRGAQLINVALGGTLFQDLPSEKPSDIAHVQKEHKFAHSHAVTVIPGTPLHAIAGQSRIAANSFHHQAANTLGKGLRVMALADDGVVEAMYLPEHRFLCAIQWHPERICDIDSTARALFRGFVESCL